MLNIILYVTSFSINYSKTHRSRLSYEINYYLYKIAQKYLKKTKKKPNFGDFFKKFFKTINLVFRSNFPALCWVFF